MIYTKEKNELATTLTVLIFVGIKFRGSHTPKVCFAGITSCVLFLLNFAVSLISLLPELELHLKLKCKRRLTNCGQLLKLSLKRPSFFIYLKTTFPTEGYAFKMARRINMCLMLVPKCKKKQEKIWALFFCRRPKSCFLASIKFRGLSNFCVIYEIYKI